MHADYFIKLLDLNTQLSEYHFEQDDFPKFLNLLSPKLLVYINSLDSFSYIPERLTLWEDETLELVLCHWAAMSDREWHFHPGTQCWFKCLHGEVLEHREEGKAYRLLAGQASYIDDSMGPHQILNDTKSSAITLHIYRKI